MALYTSYIVQNFQSNIHKHIQVPYLLLHDRIEAKRKMFVKGKIKKKREMGKRGENSEGKFFCSKSFFCCCQRRRCRCPFFCMKPFSVLFIPHAHWDDDFDANVWRNGSQRFDASFNLESTQSIAYVMRARVPSNSLARTLTTCRSLYSPLSLSFPLSCDIPLSLLPASPQAHASPQPNRRIEATYCEWGRQLIYIHRSSISLS